MREWLFSLAFGVALCLGCVPPPAPTKPGLQLDFRGYESGSQHEFGARIHVTAIVRGGSQPYEPMWRNVRTGESVAKSAIDLVLDEESGQNEYTFTARDQGGRVISERLVFLTQPEPLVGAAPPHDPGPDPDQPLATPLHEGAPLSPVFRDPSEPRDDVTAWDTSEPVAQPSPTDPRSDSSQPSAPRTELHPESTWELSSVIYNATVVTTDQVDGAFEAPLSDAVFLGELEADAWSGRIEDPLQGGFEFEATRVAPDAYQGQIRAKAGEWVPLEIIQR